MDSLPAFLFASSFTPCKLYENLEWKRPRTCGNVCKGTSILRAIAAEEGKQKKARRSLKTISVPPFDQLLKDRAPSCFPLNRRVAKTLQINIGLTCNLACRHCHVESSPSRQETMLHFVAERLLELLEKDSGISTVDITGGAPEMHSEFRFLVSECSRLGKSVIDRCNLTVLNEPGQEDLVEFLAKHQVKVIASLPCYTAENVEKQRGDKVFDSSIIALQRLNAAGYGMDGSGLDLDLVYNPLGGTLPPPQKALEADYKRELKKAFGITFSELICITNMPIKRFADDLLIRDQLNDYMELLVNSFNPSTVDNVMCREMVHVAWDGRFYDCDFNYALGMNLAPSLASDSASVPISSFPRGLSIFDVESFAELTGKRILTGKHCYGCTAGSGSSCGGSLA